MEIALHPNRGQGGVGRPTLVLGYAKIEVTSFTSPKAIPALADATEVMRNIKRVTGVVYTALVPNERGGERALECGLTSSTS